jgi:hypothetical protein
MLSTLQAWGKESFDKWGMYVRYTIRATSPFRIETEKQQHMQACFNVPKRSETTAG